MLPRQKYFAPRHHRHIIHSDFDFFLSYFYSVCSVPSSPVCCVCVCVLICLFCASTPPLSCLQLAPSVSNHPSDLTPFCMRPSPHRCFVLLDNQLPVCFLTRVCLPNTPLTSHPVLPPRNLRQPRKLAAAAVADTRNAAAR